MSDSERSYRQQPSRLPRPWDSPGKNTGVGCRFLLQCVKVKSESEVTQSCPTPSDPMDCSLPSYSIHGIFQARLHHLGSPIRTIVLSVARLPWWLSSMEPASNAGDVGSSLSQEDPLKKEMATHSGIPAWKMSWTKEPDRLQSMGW